MEKLNCVVTVNNSSILNTFFNLEHNNTYRTFKSLPRSLPSIDIEVFTDLLIDSINKEIVKEPALLEFLRTHRDKSKFIDFCDLQINNIIGDSVVSRLLEKVRLYKYLKRTIRIDNIDIVNDEIEHYEVYTFPVKQFDLDYKAELLYDSWDDCYFNSNIELSNRKLFLESVRNGLAFYLNNKEVINHLCNKILWCYVETTHLNVLVMNKSLTGNWLDPFVDGTEFCYFNNLKDVYKNRIVEMEFKGLMEDSGYTKLYEYTKRDNRLKVKIADIIKN